MFDFTTTMKTKMKLLHVMDSLECKIEIIRAIVHKICIVISDCTFAFCTKIFTSVVILKDADEVALLRGTRICTHGLRRCVVDIFSQA